MEVCRDRRMPLRFIRSFAILDTSRDPRYGRQTVIYHVQSGLTTGRFTFEEVVGSLQAYPENDHDL